MTIYETEVPGVGRKFEMEINGGKRLVVVLHHDGKRDVYLRPDEDADSEQLFTLSGDQSRKFGSILEGAYFQPVELDEVAVPLGEAIIEWHEVDDEAELAGVSLETASVRQRTGASIIAIQRGEETIPNPTPDTEIQPGDTLVTLGTREEQSEFETLIGDE
ncbi:cation:proton antiporter regulatory subunit [Halosimplex pelagicum]|uniref:Cation:proton antiporter regulatory subunit n=1 Tax=Halosimplex pelagicum TaxID=869886 RepID=A0A7D5TUF7_9EURY|nr:cation:proton antiporter regulatory subunit [Halosimplex pelagicum]QLH83192.1 cation:proton antiporter regulatory subunit [Halosimplex pelagicum]